MKLISNKRCIIGEGPVWNEKERLVYFTNAYGNEICMLDIATGRLTVRPVAVGCAAFAFDKAYNLIVSRPDGVFILHEDETVTPLYDTEKIHIRFGNDMKVGPDGRIYVGTLSGKKKGVSDEEDGKLYSIDAHGRVRVLLDGMNVPNGLEWSMDGTKFYFTDNSTKIIKEYDFDKTTGDIAFTGRSVQVPGVDGFTIDQKDRIIATGWGFGCVHVIDTHTMSITEEIPVPCRAPASCGFAGENMEYLVIVSASKNADLTKDTEAGFTYLYQPETGGRKPFLFG